MKEEKKIYITTSIEFYLKAICIISGILFAALFNMCAVIFGLRVNLVIGANIGFVISIIIMLFSPLAPSLIKLSNHISE